MYFWCTLKEDYLDSVISTAGNLPQCCTVLSMPSRAQEVGSCLKLPVEGKYKSDKTVFCLLSQLIQPSGKLIWFEHDDAS